MKNSKRRIEKEKKIRKHRTLDHFKLPGSHFYLYSIRRGWIENGKNIDVQFKYMKPLTKFLEQSTRIKIKSTYARYKKGLLKYIDDHFREFKP
jgi:hypothetical protein